MNPFALLLAGSLIAASPRIDATFPPPRDDRRPDLKVQGAPTEPLAFLTYTPDGRMLVGGLPGPAQPVHVWHARPADPAAGTLAHTLEAQGGTVKLGDQVLTLPAPASGSNGPATVVGTMTAKGHADGRITLSSEGGGRPDLMTGVGRVRALAADSKGTQLAVAGERDTEVWDLATARKLCTLAGSAGTSAVAFSPNGQKLATSSKAGLHIWTVPLPPLVADDLARIGAAVPAKATAKPRRKRRLLVFWRAEAILHKQGVPAANEAIERLGENTRAFEVDFSRDYEVFDPKILRRYDAIVLNSTAHLNIPEEKQRQALLDYVARGGGVVGIHAAIDMFKRWPEGARVVGATFAGHPWGPGGSWAVKLEEPAHPLLKAFDGKDFRLQDEFYELGEPYSRSDRRVLMKLDTADAATAGVRPLHREDRDFAVAWVKRHGKGRVFYGMFGHRAEPFMNPAVLQFYLDGIQYALGDLPVDDSPR